MSVLDSLYRGGEAEQEVTGDTGVAGSCCKAVTLEGDVVGEELC